MPSSLAILEGLSAIANGARGLAIGWHAATGAIIVALVSGWRPSRRILLGLQALPAASVSILAFAHGNPVNGASFAILAAVACLLAGRERGSAARLGRPFEIVAGAVVLSAGLAYPHFVSVDPAWMVVATAPFGLIPCPTLMALTGVALMAEGENIQWLMVLAAWGLLYGVVGAFVLGVWIDLVLIGAAMGLAGRIGLLHHHHRTQTA